MWTTISCHYSSHCNAAQIWSWCTENSSSVVNRYPAIHVISCVGEKNAIKLCFVINVLNDKTIILLNRAEHPLVLADSACGLVS